MSPIHFNDSIREECASSLRDILHCYVGVISYLSSCLPNVSIPHLTSGLLFSQFNSKFSPPPQNDAERYVKHRTSYTFIYLKI
jgi:hypothetical protein